MLQANLRTAEELYQYSLEHNLGTGLGRNWGITNFRLVEKKLEPGEKAFLSFVGLHQFRSMSSHQRNFAYAITNQRILMGQVRTFGRIRFQSVPLNEILNISFDNENSIGVMKILLDGDAVTIGMGQETAVALSRELTELLPLLQDLAYKMSSKSEDPEDDA
ncbi:MAG: PH domain-containing protein [Oscillibacter sp.]